jgi:hypothetical protein
MTKKFEASFPSATSLSPSFVYISPSDDYSNKFCVGILYPISSIGNFDSAAGIIKNFDFKQNLTASEKDALDWATRWLNQNFGRTDCTVNEVNL